MKDFCVQASVQLKVCEGCGALWLRGRNQGVYCAGCAHWLAEFPAPRRHTTHGGRKPKQRPACVVMEIPVAGAVAIQGGAR